MTEQEIECTLQYLRNRLPATGRQDAFVRPCVWQDAFIRLLDFLYEERKQTMERKPVEECQQEVESEIEIVLANAILPNTGDLYEVYCPAGVSSLVVGDKVRLHSFTQYFFVRVSDYSTHPIRLTASSPYVKLSRINLA